jgi:hypothetical protein
MNVTDKVSSLSYRYETKQPDGCTKTINVRQVTNGFVISVQKYTPGTDGKESKWEDEEYISRVDPFKADEKPDLQTILDMCC